MARGNRVAGIVASALLFGAVSGGTMVGVNVLADQHRSEIVASVNELTGQGQKESTSPIQKTVARTRMIRLPQRLLHPEKKACPILLRPQCLP